MPTKTFLAGDPHALPAPSTERQQSRVPVARGSDDHRGARIGKRVFDVALACLALLLLWPVMVVAALAIKLDTRGPVLFRQKRCGLDQSTFTILKFRTMRADGSSSFTQASQQDRRVTRVGAWLRRSSIDELPQLLNVLHGEMSLVRPRPHAVAQDHECRYTIDGYGQRARVKPGVTGWAQVNGLRGETREPGRMEARVASDIWYVEHRSFWLDLRILVRTVVAVMRLDAY